MFHPFAVGRKTSGAVQAIHGAVEGRVRRSQVGGHEVGVVKIGEGGAGVGGAGIKHGLREGVEFGGGERGWQGEGVVNHAHRIHVIAFHPPGDRAHPCHVHGGSEDGEFGESGIRQDAKFFTWDGRRQQPANRGKIPSLSAKLWHRKELGARHYSNAISRRVVGEGFSNCAATFASERTDGLKSLNRFWQLGQYIWRNISGVQNPSVNALDKLTCVGKGSKILVCIWFC